MLNPAVFLDRDGVLCRTFVRNGKSYGPAELKNFILMPNSHHLVNLQRAGFKVIVVKINRILGMDLRFHRGINAQEALQ